MGLFQDRRDLVSKVVILHGIAKCSIYVLMSDWVRIRAVIGGESREDDWIVVFQGLSVGRVYKELHTFNGFPPWRWHLWIVPTANGRSDSMDGALNALRRAYLAAS